MALNPKAPDPYLALALLIPSGRWAEREAAFRKGLSVDPDASNLQNFLAGVLFDVGRLREGLALQRNGQMLDPLSAPKSYGLAQTLMETGHVSEGLALMDRSTRIWPSHPAGWMIHFGCGHGQFRHIADVKAMLDTPQYIPVGLEPEALAAMRAYLNALQQKIPAARLAAENSLRSAAASGAVSAPRAMQMFAALDDVDSAFMLARTLFARLDSRPTPNATAPLFLNVTDSMRRDPRFTPLAAQAGLVEYWQTTGKWPDFCAEPGLPYDCRKAADHVAAAKQDIPAVARTR